MTVTSDEVNSFSSLEHMLDEEQNEPNEQKSSTIEFPPTDEMNKENVDTKRQNRLKSRSVSFAPTVQEYEIPSRHSSISSSQSYLDALCESYKLEISKPFFSFREEKKYVPKTTRTRLTPHWREHRMRRLMNKLEELSLWDREEELKVTQAQCLREQKWEQIQDRQRNHDLCLNLMRQRHESEMESAVLLDRTVNYINDENTKAIIARTMNLASPPCTPKRRSKQEQEKLLNPKTPVGRYRQFETKMNNKIDKINEKLRPDWEIMRTYNTYRASIPPTVVPLFSETYSALISVPNKKYNQHHYTASNYSHQSPEHASSPDYETRLRAHSNRDVRVPLKEQAEDSDDDNDNHSRLNSSPPRRSTNSVSSSPSANTLRERSFIHSRQPISNNIHHRNFNHDLNIVTQCSLETSKKILQNFPELSNGTSTKTRSSSAPTNKRVTFIDEDDENYNHNKSSKSKYQPEIISFSSTR